MRKLTEKPDFTVGKRGGAYYAFSNTEKARSKIVNDGVLTRPRLHEILYILKAGGYTYNLEKDLEIE